MAPKTTDYEVRKQVRGAEAWYHVPWSPLTPVDRHEISRRVPAMTGLYEVLFKDAAGHFVLYDLGLAWYGGVRSQLRQSIDAELQLDPQRRQILADRPLFYRYALSGSFADLSDVFAWLKPRYWPEAPVPEASGRYERVHVNQDGL